MPLHDEHPHGRQDGTAADLVRRFTAAERWIHRVTAALMGVALATAAALYLPALAEFVGRRRLLVAVHEWAGVLLPVPLLAGLLSRAFRADLGRLNRFGIHDRQWITSVLRRLPGPRPAAKFNAGQKLFAAVVAGAVLVMIGTGLLMWFPRLAPLFWRTGATFVHDWLAAVIGVLVCGHLWMALRDGEARAGLRTGWVTRAWALREHPLWESAAPAPGAGAADGGEVPGAGDARDTADTPGAGDGSQAADAHDAADPHDAGDAHDAGAPAMPETARRPAR